MQGTQLVWQHPQIWVLELFNLQLVLAFPKQKFVFLIIKSALVM